MPNWSLSLYEAHSLDGVRGLEGSIYVLWSVERVWARTAWFILGVGMALVRRPWWQRSIETFGNLASLFIIWIISSPSVAEMLSAYILLNCPVIRTTKKSPHVKRLTKGDVWKGWGPQSCVCVNWDRKYLGSAREFLFDGWVKSGLVIPASKLVRVICATLRISGYGRRSTGLASTAEMTCKCCTPNSGKCCQLIEIWEPSSEHLLLRIKTLMKHWLNTFFPKALKASSCSSLNQDCLTSV